MSTRRGDPAHTSGFGDFTPVQPAGKVFFIVYALAAVPIVTSFAVQTITGLVRLLRTLCHLAHTLSAEYILTTWRTEGEVRQR